jgi:histidine triad (HIT) family protein
MPDCIFCKIAAKEIPSTITYEDENVLAFLDIHPRSPGHTLLIPKAHYQWFIELPDDLSDTLFRAAKKISKKLKEEQHADYIRLSIVGKDVPHTHIHLIPQTLKEEGLGV